MRRLIILDAGPLGMVVIATTNLRHLARMAPASLWHGKDARPQIEDARPQIEDARPQIEDARL